MAAIKTDSNQAEIISDTELRGRLDHIDDNLHAIMRQLADLQAFIDEHRPALARGLSLMDPGAKLRDMMGKGRKHGT
jgi:ABC-type transporter Mla subunit MlaD